MTQQTLSSSRVSSHILSVRSARSCFLSLELKRKEPLKKFWVKHPFCEFCCYQGLYQVFKILSYSQTETYFLVVFHVLRTLRAQDALLWKQSVTLLLSGAVLVSHLCQYIFALKQQQTKSRKWVVISWPVLSHWSVIMKWKMRPLELEIFSLYNKFSKIVFIHNLIFFEINALRF